MTDQGRESGPDSRVPARCGPRRPIGTRRWRSWLLLASVALLAGGAVFARWQGLFDRPADTPLDGELIVVVRPTGANKQSLRVEEAGALPVRAGGWMSLEVHFNQPAFAYLVWLDCHGKTVPLYPWNYDAFEVTDVNEPPPTRRPAKVVISPTLGTGWRFGARGGLETVLLLARRTPLDADTQLGSILGPVPVPMRLRDDLVVLGADGRANSVYTLLAMNRGAEQEAQAADEPLRALIVRLREHFELIRAVRFAHEQ